jgi:MFS family permease
MIPALGASYAGVAIASLILGVTAFGTHPILQTLIAHTTSGGNRDTGLAWFYTAIFLAGAFWSPALGYLSDWWGLKAGSGVMAISLLPQLFACYSDVSIRYLHTNAAPFQPAVTAKKNLVRITRFQKK